MKKMTLVEIVKAVGAISYNSCARFTEIDNVQFDSRLCRAGSLFVPLKGARDGHDYVQSAREKGAIATFWDRPEDEAPDNILCIIVDDVLEAFQKLARYYLTLIQPKVVAITGSNGKTTTKDMTAAIAASTYRTHQTQGNFNNEIGVPKTILDMPEDTQVLVVELGMDNFGQIAQLSQLVQPDIAVITLVGDSHLAFLGSRQGIAQAKMEITTGLKVNGVLILPCDEPLLKAQVTDQYATYYFGQDAQADASISNVVTTQNETRFTIGDATYTLPVLGAYNARNAAASILVARQLHIPVAKQCEALAHFKLSANRTEWVIGAHDSLVLNDAYNASPTSMKAILKDFQNLTVKNRRFIVLGDMRELGENSGALHADLAQDLDMTRLDKVFLFGVEMQHLAQRLIAQGHQDKVVYVQDDLDVLAQSVQQHLEKDDYILVKSSYGTNLLAFVQKIKQNN